jgi:hypothetical protein
MFGPSAFKHTFDLHRRGGGAKLCSLHHKFIGNFLDPHTCSASARLLRSLFVIVNGQKGMADYYALISDGVAALDKKTSEARREFYDRARAILADKLRNADPPLSEAIIEQERLALEDAVSKVEADETPSEGTLSLPSGLQTQSDHAEEQIRSAALEAAWAQLDEKVQMRRERRFAFWGFMIVYAFWMGDLFFERPTFSDWYDWLRLGGVIFFGALTILSYSIMRENWSAEQEERAYIVFTPISSVGAVLVSAALYFAFGRHAATPL